MKLLFTIAALLLATSAQANVVLPDVISDGMVLQCNQAVPIWGKADPSEVVIVRFEGQTKKTTAGNDGNWLLKLDPMRANATPSSMVVEGKNKVEIKDILIGEVWLVA